MWEILGTGRIWGLGQISTWIKLDIIPRVGFGVETWVFREKMTGTVACFSAHLAEGGGHFWKSEDMGESLLQTCDRLETLERQTPMAP